MLSHLKVLDLTEGLGAYGSRMLAALGADVLKVELRGGEPAAASKNASAAGFVWNAGKRRAALDLHGEADREALHGLIAQSDIVVRNRADVPLEHASLAELNSRLIDVVVAPFDPRGALQSRPAADLTLMARSGLMAITGDPDRAPLTLPGEQAYALAGIQAAIAALTALHARNASGRGQLVSVSAFQAAVLANYREPLMWQWAGRVGKRTGNLLVRGKSGVRQVWPCRDGYVTWSFVDNPGMMRALVGLMKGKGMGAALADVDWDATLVADTPRETLIDWERNVEAFFQTHTRAELAGLSVAHGFGLSQIDDADDVLASQHLRERALWKTLAHPDREAVQVPGPLFRTSEAANQPIGGRPEREADQ